VSEHSRGYDIMKGIMASESSTKDQGVPSLAYSPADASMPLLFSLDQPISYLEKSLFDHFEGEELRFMDLYKRHSVDTPYIEKNYKEVLKQLEKKGAIEVRTTKGKRRAGTFADHVLIKFLKRGRNGQ